MKAHQMLVGAAKMTISLILCSSGSLCNDFDDCVQVYLPQGHTVYVLQPYFIGLCMCLKCGTKEAHSWGVLKRPRVLGLMKEHLDLGSRKTDVWWRWAEILPMWRRVASCSLLQHHWCKCDQPFYVGLSWGLSLILLAWSVLPAPLNKGEVADLFMSKAGGEARNHQPGLLPWWPVFWRNAVKFQNEWSGGAKSSGCYGNWGNLTGYLLNL